MLSKRYNEELYDFQYQSIVNARFDYFESFYGARVFREKQKVPFLKFFKKTERKRIVEIIFLEYVYVAEVLSEGLDVYKIITEFEKGDEEVRLKFF